MPELLQATGTATCTCSKHGDLLLQNICKEAQFPEQQLVIDTFLTYLSGIDNAGNWVDPYQEIFLRPPPPAPPGSLPPPVSAHLLSSTNPSCITRLTADTELNLSRHIVNYLHACALPGPPGAPLRGNRIKCHAWHIPTASRQALSANCRAAMSANRSGTGAVRRGCAAHTQATW